MSSSGMCGNVSSASPSELTTYDSLVRRRIASKDGLGTPEVEMDS